SANLFPGGYAGLSRLISEVLRTYTPFPVSFSVLYFILNGITTLFVWKRIGHRFILLSILFYTLTSLFTAVLPRAEITSDLLLMAVFGG
ncbi:MAG TPA: YitT family protein, partial [Erysipelotrichaceae bacterium]|nr:YitT family protein [Erysipelotrichaceae bacterium]